MKKLKLTISMIAIVIFTSGMAFGQGSQQLPTEKISPEEKEVIKKPQTKDDKVIELAEKEPTFL